MSRYIEIVIFVSGDETDKETFKSTLDATAASAGWTVDGSTFIKNEPYANSSSAVEDGLYALISSAYIAGLTISTTCNSQTVNWI